MNVLDYRHDPGLGGSLPHMRKPATQRNWDTVLKAFDEDVLIRNIARDHEPGWAMRLLPLMGALGRLAKSQPPTQGETTEAP